VYTKSKNGFTYHCVDSKFE